MSTSLSFALVIIAQLASTLLFVHIRVFIIGSTYLKQEKNISLNFFLSHSWHRLLGDADSLFCLFPLSLSQTGWHALSLAGMGALASIAYIPKRDWREEGR